MVFWNCMSPLLIEASWVTQVSAAVWGRVRPVLPDPLNNSSQYSQCVKATLLSISYFVSSNVCLQLLANSNVMALIGHFCFRVSMRLCLKGEMRRLRAFVWKAKCVEFRSCVKHCCYIAFNLNAGHLGVVQTKLPSKWCTCCSHNTLASHWSALAFHGPWRTCPSISGTSLPPGLLCTSSCVSQACGSCWNCLCWSKASGSSWFPSWLLFSVKLASSPNSSWACPSHHLPSWLSWLSAVFCPSLSLEPKVAEKGLIIYASIGALCMRIAKLLSLPSSCLKQSLFVAAGSRV